MSFSARVKNEVARIIPERSCCQRAELAALTRVVGILRIGSGQEVLVIVTGNVATARKIFQLSKRLDCPVTIEIHQCNQPRHHHLFHIQFPLQQKGSSVLKELGLIDHRNRLRDYLKSSLFDRICCRRVFLRGCFLGSGFVNRPDGSYHLEVVLESVEGAKEVSAILAKFKLVPGLRERKGSFVVYLKDAEQVGEFLRIIGATQAILEFENSRILKEVRNQVNRLVNCETANLEKAVEAGLAQIEDIKYIAAHIGLDSLHPLLRELAELRLRYPEASLRELGRLLIPPVGKSGVNHRFRALREIVQQLRSKQGVSEQPLQRILPHG